MALMVCPECGKQVSDQAEACPNCGYPIPKYIAEQKKQAELAAAEAKKAEAAAVIAKATKKPVSTKTKIIIAACVFVIIGGLTAGYVFGIKQPYDHARAAYASMLVEYENAVAAYTSVADQVVQKNEELDAKINSLNDLVYSDKTPYDMTTIEAAVNMIAEAKTVKVEQPEMPVVRTAEDFLEYTVFQSADILAEVEVIRNEKDTILAAAGQLNIPDYSDVFEKLENTQQSIENSILQNDYR